MEYEQPPSDCWETMDPAQRHAWLRDHQLPNKKPCKFELTDTHDLTRRQIRKLKKLKRPESFHNQSSSSEPYQLTSLPEPQTCDPALTINPNQLSEPTLPPPRKRNLLNHQYDLDGTKKPRPEYTPDIYATNEDPLPQPLTPIIDGTITSDPSQTENDSQERFQNDKRKQLDQQHFSNDDTQEAKKQRLPHEPDTSTITEPPSTDPLIHISVTIETMCTSTSTDPQLEPLSIRTFSQIQSQPQTIESSSNEASLDSLIQDQIDTVTRGFNPHAGPTTIESPSETLHKEPATPTQSLITENPAQLQPPPQKPSNWNEMSKTQKRNWLRRKLGE